MQLYTTSLITTRPVIPTKAGIQKNTGFRVKPGMTNRKTFMSLFINSLAFYQVGGIGIICLTLVFLGLSGFSTTFAEPSTNAPGVGSEMGQAEEGTTPPEEKNPQPAGGEASSIQERWGIEIIRIRISAGGHMLDFRYRVINPDKALPILDFKVKPYLIDQKSGTKFQVPNPPKVGSLRQTTRSGKPIAGRIYFMLFSNPGHSVQTGSKVTVVIGEFRVENLVVE